MIDIVGDSHMAPFGDFTKSSWMLAAIAVVLGSLPGAADGLLQLREILAKSVGWSGVSA